MTNPELYVPSDHVDWRAIGWVVVVAALGNGWAWTAVLVVPLPSSSDRWLSVVLAPVGAAFLLGLSLVFVRGRRRVGVILLSGAVLAVAVMFATAMWIAASVAS